MSCTNVANATFRFVFGVIFAFSIVFVFDLTTRIMGNDPSRLLRDAIMRRYPGDPTRQLFEAAKSGNAVVLSEFLEQMNTSERASALETKTTYQK